MSLVLPTIHLNGTGRETLLRSYFDAITAVRMAQLSFESIEFHPRDYYPKDDMAWQKARDEHIAQYKNLMEVEIYLAEIYLHLNSQNE